MITGLKEQYPEVLVMADAGSADDARAAQEAGADILGTTLSGYTGERPKSVGPDLELVAEIAAFAERPLIVEGRVHTLAQAAAAMDAGAFLSASARPLPIPARSPDGSPTRWLAPDAGSSFQV